MFGLIATHPKDIGFLAIFPAIAVEPISPTIFNLFAYLDFAGTDTLSIQQTGPSLQTTAIHLGTVSLTRTFPSRLEIKAIAITLEASLRLALLQISEARLPRIEIHKLVSPTLAAEAIIGSSLEIQPRSPVVTLKPVVPTVTLTYVDPARDQYCS